jgi:hypothetical protein
VFSVNEIPDPFLLSPCAACRFAAIASVLTLKPSRSYSVGIEGIKPLLRMGPMNDEKLLKSLPESLAAEVRKPYVPRGQTSSPTHQTASDETRKTDGPALQEFAREYSEEADPTGRKPSDPGAKLDAGKQRAALVLRGFCRALDGVIGIGTHGAAKYSPGGWQEVPEAEERYLDALYRHLQADARGEANDKDSGLTHLAHAAWNILAVLELRERKNA